MASAHDTEEILRNLADYYERCIESYSTNLTALRARLADPLN